MAMVSSVTKENATGDTAAMLNFLAEAPEVADGPVGTTGYCMGGGLALNAAGRFPDQVGAAASFHGGRIATTAPDSPHLLAGSMKATVYVAGAENDASFDDEQFERLNKALTGAGSTSPWSPIPRPTASPSRTIRPTTRPQRRPLAGDGSAVRLGARPRVSGASRLPVTCGRSPGVRPRRRAARRSRRRA